MFPVSGNPDTLGFKVHNTGSVACTNALVRLSAWREGESPQPFSGDHLLSIAAGGTALLEVDWTPALPGSYQVEVSIDPDNQVPELDEANNQLAVSISVLNRDLFFVWYGAPEELPNANVPALRQNMIAEWKRRGAVAAGVGLVGPHEVEKYREMATNGFNGVVIDEIGNADATTVAFLADLADFRTDYPDFFIGVWSILSPPCEELSQMVLDGTIDLVIIERYLFVGEDVGTNLQKIIDDLDAEGLLLKSMIGLGSASAYANYEDAATHTAFLEQQIQYIQTNAPEMPGVGFFTSGTLPGVDEALNQMCHDYFVNVNMGGAQ
jgi:hypothetical protein